MRGVIGSRGANIGGEFMLVTHQSYYVEAKGKDRQIGARRALSLPMSAQDTRVFPFSPSKSLKRSECERREGDIEQRRSIMHIYFVERSFFFLSLRNSANPQNE